LEIIFVFFQGWLSRVMLCSAAPPPRWEVFKFVTFSPWLWSIGIYLVTTWIITIIINAIQKFGSKYYSYKYKQLITFIFFSCLLPFFLFLFFLFGQFDIFLPLHGSLKVFFFPCSLSLYIIFFSLSFNNYIFIL